MALVTLHSRPVRLGRKWIWRITRTGGSWSIAEWRLAPRRLNDELCKFLDEVWSRPVAVAAAG